MKYLLVLVGILFLFIAMSDANEIMDDLEKEDKDE